MIERILPVTVATADTRGDTVDGRLFPAEEAVVRRATARRRREFGTVRACARAALAGLGHPPVPILPGERGAPRWPAGTVGSMTHCRGYRGAAVARSTDLAALGIDASPDLPLPEGVLEFVAAAEEAGRVAALLAARPSVHWDRLLFSAKESAYKAWYPLVGGPADPSGFDVTFSAAGRAFRARPPDGGPALLHGRWLARDGLVLTAVVAPRYSPGNGAAIAADRCATA
ncbi:4'-phosphopantetheinyl transferase [Kitasatospora sp. NPDC057015]|uniref:4'-phosphopantetheinyl transferase family protein n=1 Tax=Kitasatospora sp. NPDC057015 TaxID=3346001 RepID=UPI003635B525